MLAIARQDHAPSYYAATAHPRPPSPELSETCQADVCVVGGGLAGLSAALELAERGYSVVVLEAARVGFGASGRNGGQVIAGYACETDSLRRLVGEEAARTMWQMSVEAVELIDSRVRRYGIACDWTRGFASVAVKPRQMEALRAWVDSAAAEFDYPHLEVWEQPLLAERLASGRYVGGVYDRFSGHLHPLNYTLGLARAAEAAGVRIHENTPVVRIEHGTMPVAHTERGAVRCSHLVLACNAYIGALVPELDRRIMPAGTYVIATEPLGEARARALIANNMAVCDTNFVLDYYRLSADHRLLFGGKVSYSGREPANLADAMRQDMLRVFPQLEDVRVEYAWGGYCDITVNRAPDFGRLSANVYYVQGFSGHGVNVSNIAGRLVGEAIAGSAERFDLFGRIRHRNFPGGRLFRTPALVAGMAYYRLRDYL